MDGFDLQALATARAQELPGSELVRPFGPEWDVHKVRGKVFMLQSVLDGREIVTLKATPSDAIALRSAHPDITPGYHMNKRHWITVRPGPSIDPELVADLVLESYLLVVEKLPRAIRPVNPDTYGRPPEPPEGADHSAGTASAAPGPARPAAEVDG